MRNLQEQVKKPFCYQNCSDLSLLEKIGQGISKFFSHNQNNFGNKMPLNFSRIHQELPFPPGKDQKISNKNVSLGSQRFLPKMNGHNPAENHRSRLGFTSW